MVPAISMPGPTELAFILLIVMIVFGAGKLPDVLASLGKGVKAFKDGQKDEPPPPTDVTPPKAIAKDAGVSEAHEVRKERV
jgi:sec-independent protein translocase protein TatA